MNINKRKLVKHLSWCSCAHKLQRCLVLSIISMIFVYFLLVIDLSRYTTKATIPALQFFSGTSLSDRLKYSNNIKENISQSTILNKHLPGCIIVGARKCGTRALLEFLGIHPRIHRVIDELHFFDDDDKYSLGLDWYLNRMPITEDDKIVIEKTPAYFVTESVPKRIYSMNPKTKIILIVRDPITRLISDYAQLASNKALKDLQTPSLEELILLPNGAINSNFKGIKISMYAIHFLRWLKLFSRDQIHIVDGDRFVYDPFPELSKVENFLGLSNEITRDNFVYNVTKGFYCIRNDDTGNERCLNKNKGRKHPDVNLVTLKKLRKFFDPYNRYFYKLAGQQFEWPGAY